MPISAEALQILLETLEPGIKVYRDEAPSNAKYPYIVFEFVSERYRKVSNRMFAEMPLYQIAYITKGIETELSVLKSLFKQNQVLYEGFTPMAYDENDKKVTQFVTYVRCINA